MKTTIVIREDLSIVSIFVGKKRIAILKDGMAYIEDDLTIADYCGELKKEDVIYTIKKIE